MEAAAAAAVVAEGKCAPIDGMREGGREGRALAGMTSERGKGEGDK